MPFSAMQMQTMKMKLGPYLMPAGGRIDTHDKVTVQAATSCIVSTQSCGEMFTIICPCVNYAAVVRAKEMAFNIVYDRVKQHWVVGR